MQKFTVLRHLVFLLLQLLLVSQVALAADYGPPADVASVKKVVKAKYHHVANVSVSHDWALCISNEDENDLSVVLHRIKGQWKIVKTDGGAFKASDLGELGVPKADQGALLRSYHS